MVSQIPNGGRYFEAVQRFDIAARENRRAFAFAMQPGDLYLIDNRRVGHARNPFPEQRIDFQGEIHYNPRHLMNIHLK
jgi:alpha-ketoglutarate-dependent taurine dioxygenase